MLGKQSEVIMKIERLTPRCNSSQALHPRAQIIQILKFEYTIEQ